MEIATEKQYQWNQNWAAAIAHTDINLVIAELKDIQEIRGEITPEYVIESAKNKKSTLYNFFEWDNEKAAAKWRIQQASRLLRNIEVITITDGYTKKIRAFEVIKRIGEETSFVSFDSSSSSSSSRNKSISLGDLNRTINRLESFPEYKVVVSWLKKSALLLSSIEPINKHSTETKKPEIPLAAVV